MKYQINIQRIMKERGFDDNSFDTDLEHIKELLKGLSFQKELTERPDDFRLYKTLGLSKQDFADRNQLA